MKLQLHKMRTVIMIPKGSLVRFDNDCPCSVSADVNSFSANKLFAKDCPC